MIQDIAPYIFDNHFKNISPKEDSYVIFIKEHYVLCKRIEQNISFPTYQELQPSTKTTFMFSIDDKDFFLGGNNRLTKKLLKEFQFYDIEKIMNYTPKQFRYAAAVACQIKRWYCNNGYCGRCGARLYKAKNERILFCRKCLNTVYPKVCPAVIVGIVHEDKILITKYIRSSRPALVAGFAEVGESIEDTVRREVMEEVGIKIKNIKYYKSQPWAFSDSLLLGFFCELDGSDKVRVDLKELSEAVWISKDNIQNIKHDINLTSEMIMKFKNDKSEVNL